MLYKSCNVGWRIAAKMSIEVVRYNLCSLSVTHSLFFFTLLLGRCLSLPLPGESDSQRPLYRRPQSCTTDDQKGDPRH